MSTLAMDYAEYVLSGYGVVLGAIGAYSLWLLRRGRAASRHVPPEERRWSQSP
jgi:hypothetical protein